MASDDVCPVCEGSGLLLSKVCPLCEGEAISEKHEDDVRSVFEDSESLSSQVSPRDNPFSDTACSSRGTRISDTALAKLLSVEDIADVGMAKEILEAVGGDVQRAMDLLDFRSPVHQQAEAADRIGFEEEKSSNKKKKKQKKRKEQKDTERGQCGEDLEKIQKMEDLKRLTEGRIDHKMICELLQAAEWDVAVALDFLYAADQRDKPELVLEVMDLSSNVMKVPLMSVDIRVAELKYKLTLQGEAHASRLQLSLEGRLLEDYEMLADYTDLLKKAPLQLFRKSPGEKPIEVPDEELQRIRMRIQGFYNDMANRIVNEFAELANFPSINTIGPIEKAEFMGMKGRGFIPFGIQIAIDGPKDTPYEGGVFWVTIGWPVGYPFNPPRFRFDTHIFHPNISSASVGIPGLSIEWSPAITTGKLLLTLTGLMSRPEFDDPCANPEAGVLGLSDPEAFAQRARSETQAHAVPAAR